MPRKVEVAAELAQGALAPRKLRLKPAAKETFFAGLFGRLKPRIEGKGAAWAVAHRNGKVIWLILHEEVEYEEKGPGKIKIQSLNRKFRRLMKEFARHGVDPRSMLDEIPAFVPVQAPMPERAEA